MLAGDGDRQRATRRTPEPRPRAARAQPRSPAPGPRLPGPQTVTEPYCLSLGIHSLSLSCPTSPGLPGAPRRSPAPPAPRPLASARQLAAFIIFMPTQFRNLRCPSLSVEERLPHYYDMLMSLGPARASANEAAERKLRGKIAQAQCSVCRWRKGRRARQRGARGTRAAPPPAAHEQPDARPPPPAPPGTRPLETRCGWSAVKSLS